MRMRVLFVTEQTSDLPRSIQALQSQHDVLVSDATDTESALRSIRQSDIVCLAPDAAARRFLDSMDFRQNARRLLVISDAVTADATLDLLSAYPGVQACTPNPAGNEFSGLLASLAYPRQSPRTKPLGFVVDISLDPDPLTIGELPLIDISNQGCGFLLSARTASRRLQPGTLLRKLCVRRGNEVVMQNVDASVCNLTVGEPRLDGQILYRVGVAFVTPPRTKPNPIERCIAEPLRIWALLRDPRCLASLSLRRFDSAEPFNFTRPEARLLGQGMTAVLSSAADIVAGDVLRAAFEVVGESYAFVTSVLALTPTADGTIVRFAVPRALRVTRRRRSVRFRPPADHPVLVDVASPFEQSGEWRPVLDLTTSGLAFALRNADEVLPVGTLLPALRLRFSEGDELRCSGRVRVISHLGTIEKCGVEFEEIAQQDQDRLADAIAHTGQPDLRDARGTPFSEIWEFFERSGFVYPDKREGLDLPGTMRTFERLLSGTNEVYKGTIFVRLGTIHAHVSAIKLYRRTWMLQHLAAQPLGKRPQSVARIMNLALLDYLEQKPEIEWIRVSYRPENRAPARLFTALSRHSPDPALSRTTTWTCMRASARMTTSVRSSGQSTLTVGPADDDDLQFVENYFLARGDMSLLQQEDLFADDVELSKVSEEYQRVGLLRRREILVARDGPRLAGFALLEHSSPGLNLSELTSAFRVFSASFSALDPRPSLLAAVRHRYAELGRDSAIALVEERDAPVFLEAGFEPFRRYAFWTWHRSLYRHFYDHMLQMLR